MGSNRSLWLLLPRQLRTLPADLAAMIGLTLLVNVAVFAPVIRETPLRIPLGLAFVLFVPGYVFVAALFPEAGDPPAAPDDVIEGESPDDSFWGGADRSGIDGIERVALAFGLSIAIVPLIGLALNFTPWGIRLVPIMVAVSGFTLLAAGVAAVRRWQLPAEERFAVPYRQWYATGRRELFEPDTRADAALNVLLVAAILLAVGSVAYAVAVPPQGEQFSAVYILTEDDDGDLVAADYPDELAAGESADIVLGVDNHEHRTVDYTVVLVEQQVETVGNETVVTDQNELERFETQLAHNESWHHDHEIEPTMTGDDVRIVWLLYPDEVPDDPSMDSTEYSVHLWIDVEDGEVQQRTLADPAADSRAIAV